MTQELCTILSVGEPAVLALAFTAGLMFGIVLDHIVFPIVIHTWLALVRRPHDGA